MQAKRNDKALVAYRRSFISTRLAILILMLLIVVSMHSYWFAMSTIDSCYNNNSNERAKQADGINSPDLYRNNEEQQLRQEQERQNVITAKALLQQPASITSTTTTNTNYNGNHHRHTRIEDATDGRQFLGAIGVFSAVDWALQPPYYMSHLSYRNFVRNTWMSHPACRDGRFLCYFILGSEPMTHTQWRQIPKGQYNHHKNQTYRIDLNRTSSNDYSRLVALEMKEYGDIVVLPGKDHYNFGKANEWWEWIVLAQKRNLFSAKYHWKADVESYLHIDNLLDLIQNNLQPSPILHNQRILMGKIKLAKTRSVVKRSTNGWEQMKDLKWAMGWGYGMSNQLIQDIQQCIETYRQANDTTIRLYNKGEHEDVFVGVVIRLCDLKVDFQHINTKVLPLVEVLAEGCPTTVTADIIAIHCGGELAAKAFQPIPEEIFKRLHDIYYPSTTNSFGMLQQQQYDQHHQQKQQQLPSSTSSSLAGATIKWATLWHYFMKVHGVCTNQKGSPKCGGENGVRECFPA